MALYSRVYFNIGSEWIYQGETEETSWSVSKFNLQYAQAYQWRVDIYDSETGVTTTGDEWAFTIKNCPASFDLDRPEDYDEEKVWGWDGEDYNWISVYDGFDVVKFGGGRYKQQLVVVGYNTVYFGET